MLFFSTYSKGSTQPFPEPTEVAHLGLFRLVLLSWLLELRVGQPVFCHLAILCVTADYLEQASSQILGTASPLSFCPGAGRFYLTLIR